MASLKLNGVNKIYPSGESALFNIEFQTKDKEFIVIVGGEASGKSTLLRIIAGLEEPSSGAVLIDNKDVTDVDPKDRDVAMVFRSSTLYPALNVFDNMAFGLRLRKAPQAVIEQRVKAAAAILGLEDVLYRKPKTLSAAVRQRVAIGRAIVREPRLYLFDEPLSGLDDALRADMLNVIINLQARMEGAFVYATKNLAEAMAIGTRIVVLKNGLLQQIDTPQNLYDYPANAYVAFYIGAPTINFIKDAVVSRTGQGYTAVAAGFEIALPQSIADRFDGIADYADSGKKVLLGIRPEDAEVKLGGGFGGYECTVGKVEADNDRTYAECALKCGISMIVRGQEQLSSGAPAEIAIDAAHLYIFDNDTRLTLLARDSGYKKTDFAEADFVPLTFEEEQQIIEKLSTKKTDKKKKLR